MSGIRRGPKACTQCRKLKRSCEGGEPPCARCVAAGHPQDCVFERPGSSIIHDAGLARLANIEASLALQERRLDTMVENIGSLTAVLAEISKKLPRIQESNPSPNGSWARPAESQWASTSQSILNQFSHTTPPLNNIPVASPTFQVPKRAVIGDTATPDDITRFAANISRPIEALAEAAATASAATDGLNEDYAALQESRLAALESKKRPYPTSHIPGTVLDAAPEDLVGCGAITDGEARSLHHLWEKEISVFCPLLDSAMDTYESLRSRSAFLFNTILDIAMRCSGTAQSAAVQRCIKSVQSSCLSNTLSGPMATSPELETIQALLINACFHTEPYVTTGYAVRLCLAGHYETTWSMLDEHGWQKTDNTARRLSAQLRTWLYAIFLDFKHSRYSGRMIPFRQEDMDELRGKIDDFLKLPLSLPNDYRHVANFQCIFLERKILMDSQRLVDPTFQTHRTYIQNCLASIQTSYAAYEAIGATLFTSLSYPRRSQERIYHDSILYLVSNVYKEHLFNPAIVDESTIQLTLSHAQSAIRTVLDSPVYSSRAKYSGYLLRVDLSFACLVLLKLAKAYPSYLENTGIVSSNVLGIANLLEGMSGSQRYAKMLRHAYLEYLHSQSTRNIEGSSNFSLHRQHNGEVATVQDPATEWLSTSEFNIDDWLALPTSGFTESSDLLLNHDWLATLGGGADWQTSYG